MLDFSIVNQQTVCEYCSTNKEGEFAEIRQGPDWFDNKYCLCRDCLKYMLSLMEEE